MTHTAGPWRVERIGWTEVNPLEIWAAGSQSMTLAQIIGRPSPEIEANARLIAAAPALLEALQELMHCLSHIEDFKPEFGCDATDNARRKCARAISSALPSADKETDR